LCGDKELIHCWNKRLKEEGLGVYKRGREILLPDLSYFVEEEKEERKDIHLPLDILSPRQKEVVYLLYYDCLSETEAGRQLGLSRSTIRTHKKRALRKLKRKLAR
jgi:RNA polymerase sigma factor (sigma-70 family)